jgi:hypothetical protein
MISSIGVAAILMTMTGQGAPRASSMLGGDRKPAATAKPEPARAKDNRKPAATPKAAPATDLATALAEYNALRAKTPHNLAGESKLAMWCDEHGLKAEAYAHYAQVVRMDPRREIAWRKLGFKKYGGRWMTDAQIAEQEGWKKSEKLWLPRLKKIHKDIHGSSSAKKYAAAREAFEAIRDERAIPSLYREFVSSPNDQILLIQALDRITTPLATKVLAMIAVYGQTPDVRRRATEILRGRPSEDYLELLVGLMVDPFKYEVQPVGGPGSPGALFVEGEKFNLSRIYAPPAVPNIVPQPGDVIAYDRNGVPGVIRWVAAMAGVPGSSTLAYRFRGEVRLSEPQMLQEAQRAAQAAENQLESDVAQVKAINAARRHFSELVIAVAAYATGKDRGPTPKDWREAVLGAKALKQSGDEPSKNPTITELVPLGYQPAFAQLVFMKADIVPDS